MQFCQELLIQHNAGDYAKFSATKPGKDSYPR
jgi:hypothetical protein